MHDHDYLFTAADRAKTCIHEAAHAVVNALSGAFIDELAVRPVSDESWQYTNRRGLVRTDIDGICCVNHQHSAKFPYIQWDDDNDCMSVNRQEYKKHIQSLMADKKYLSEERRQIRANVCSLLAGSIADAIIDGFEVVVAPECNEIGNNDICNAEALCMLLPYRSEFDFLAAETELLLRTPEIWDRVRKLAAALEAAGTLNDDIPFLPDPIPNWPPSPYSKK